MIRCKDTDRKFINSEIKKCSKGSPFVWTQEAMVSIMADYYRKIQLITEELARDHTYGNKVKTIEEIISM